MTRLRTVALLARQPGVNVLRDALLGHPHLDLALVVTHPALPKAEGGGERPENQLFADLCAAHGVPFATLPAARAREGLAALLPPGRLDLLVSLSWRAMVPPAVLDRFGATVNLHRGALPTYAGAEPVRRAIEAGERMVAITAHRMVEEVDAGDPWAVVWMPISPPPAGTDAATHAETVKQALEPLYAPLAKLAVETALLSRK